MTGPFKKEAEWRAFDRLDQGLPAADEEDAKVRAPYERLIKRLREADEMCEAPAGWENDLDACWEAERRRIRRRNIGGGVAAAAIALSLLVLCFRAGAVCWR
ncbi:MAG: hypothetical protein IPI49_12465 [Myxococcales bacterium]|nr:hypothetical protein [Myxococcales bacterium]